jgi:hypothetical protein
MAMCGETVRQVAWFVARLCGHGRQLRKLVALELTVALDVFMCAYLLVCLSLHCGFMCAHVGHNVHLIVDVTCIMSLLESTDWALVSPKLSPSLLEAQRSTLRCPAQLTCCAVRLGASRQQSFAHICIAIKNVNTDHT